MTTSMWRHCRKEFHYDNIQPTTLMTSSESKKVSVVMLNIVEHVVYFLWEIDYQFLTSSLSEFSERKFLFYSQVLARIHSKNSTVQFIVEIEFSWVEALRKEETKECNTSWFSIHQRPPRMSYCLVTI